MLSVKIGQYHPSLEDSFVNTIQALKKDGPLTPLAVVAPTNWMLNRLQERLVMGQDASPGSRYTKTSFMNISFMNFSVFASEICRRSGADVGQIVRHSVVYEYLIAGLLKQHTHGEPLFKNVQSLPALAGSLYQVIQDLADANVHIDSLKEAAKEGFIEGAEVQKLNGVINLYDLFKQKLKNLHISHYADVYHLAASYVQDSKFLKNFKYILAYGFYDLTGVEQDFFGEIFRSHPTMLFLPYQRKHPSFAYVKPFFESFVLGMARDVEELPPVAGFSCLMNSQLEDTAHVREFQGEIQNPKLVVSEVEPSETCGEQSRTIQNPDNTQYLANVHIIDASGKRDEVWTVAKEILQLAGAGYKMDEIGVVARTLEPYADAINKIFQENDIPFTTSTHEPLERYPLVKVIRQILLLKREDYYRPMVVELLNSPYFKTPAFDHKGVTPRPDLWDILSRRLGIRGGIECWLSRLDQAKSAPQELPGLDKTDMSEDVIEKDGTTPPASPSQGGDKKGVKGVFSDEEETGRHIRIPVNQIEFLTNILRKLSTDLSSIPEKASWAAMSRSIALFLQTYINFPSEGINPEGQKRDHLIINKISELLHTLCTLDCLNEEVTQDQFVDTFLDACRQEGLPVGIENGRGVKVLDAMSARGIPFRALFILGLNEKVFPRAISEEPFLRDHIRRRLSGVLGNLIPEKLRGFEEERLLFYFLLNAAQEQLYLLYERSDEAGKPKVQSHYLMDILQKVKNISIARNDYQDHSIYVPRGIKDKLFGKEISLLTPKEVGIRMALDKIDPASFMTAFGTNPVLFARSQSALDFIEGYKHPHLTAYDGVIGDISPWWEKRACHGISPTTLEAFGICPFKFFMGKVLELESLEEPEKIDVIAAVDLGSLYHRILKDFYGHLIEKGYFYKKAKGLNPIELLHGIAQKYFTDIEQKIPIPYPILWENKKEEVLGFLTKFVTWDLDRIEQTGYIPTYLERKAHLSAQDELIKLMSVYSKQDKASELTFKGKIDRIDVKSTENAIKYRVIDYKSGKYPKENLLKSAIRGQKLQLPFYIVMAERLLSEEIRKRRIRQGQTSLADASFVYIAQDMEDKKGQKGTPEKTIKGDDWQDSQGQCWETVKEFLHYIREGIFPISPTEDTQKCEWCEFVAACRRGHQPLRARLEQDARLKRYREIGNLGISKKSNKS
ncbi:MAG: exodeoxyribonuclease V subunit gamma [Planctomycetes bacterium]|uniref:PD-(D/E)XK nuclease family protein n=1 Tax=Candidatus Wunengus californicus TaxID=3367619 RepID=UPI00402A52EF|nr:exodeoxyribonuclease V subunit gamma [Planctomycetota bacterium]